MTFERVVGIITKYEIHPHEILMYTQARKRIVSVTLDIECYDDLDLEDINWSDILGLEGDEKVDISIRELADIF